ncbi:hypothetical protein ABG067_007671 [Albugo candida]
MSEPILVKSHRQPIFSAYGARNRHERLRSSRLLTHGHQDPASRNAYSTAIAEKAINCLQKLKSLMEKERKKPTAGCSVSWANCQLTRTQKKLEREAIPEHTTTQPEKIPPIKTLSAIFSIPKATSTTDLKPPSPVVSDTIIPIAGVKTLRKRSSTQKHVLNSPVSSTGSTETQVDRKWKFLFSPPPTERCTPRKPPSQNQFSALKVHRPFSFVPALPKVQNVKLSEVPPSKVHTTTDSSKVHTTTDSSKELNGKEEHVEKAAQTEDSPSNALETSNLLVRFMQMASGQ